MKGLISRAGTLVSGLAVLLTQVKGVLAQDDFDWDYDYDYEYDPAAAEAAGALGAGIFGAMWLIWCCFALIGLALLVFRILMLVHAIKHAPQDQKTLWIVLILLVPFCDWVYFFTKKKEWGGNAPKPVSEAKPSAPAQ